LLRRLNQERLENLSPCEEELTDFREGDYLELNWQEFGDQHGYPKAAVFMPLCGAKSRQHPIGKHYNAWHKPVLDLAVKADQCVAKKSA
jgi:hypothetical protein